MARASNTASVASVSKLLQYVYPQQGVGLAKGCYGTVSEFLAAHVEFMVRVLSISQRPTKVLLLDAIRSAFDSVEEATASCFVALVLAVLTKARNTKRSTRTGDRLDPSMLRVVQALQAPVCGVSPSPSPSPTPVRSPSPSPRAKRSRTLAAHDSDASVVSIKSDAPCVELPSGAASSSSGMPASSSMPSDAILDMYLHALDSSSARSTKTSPREPPAATMPTPVQYADGTVGKVIRLYPDGRCVEAVMSPGPNGFALATFHDEEPIECEMPNILLPDDAAAPLAEPLAATPALQDSAVPDPLVALDEEPVETVLKHRVVWYARSHRAAVRRSEPAGKQICSFSRANVSKEQLMQIAKEAVDALAHGTLAEDDAKAWCKESLSRLP